MSEYGYDDGPRRHRTTRTRDPEYVTETTYIQRGSGQPSRELVYRPREDSIEDIPRDFPPGTEYRRTKVRDEYDSRRARSVGHRDPYDDDYGYVVPGAAAGYAAGRARGRRAPREDDYYSDYEPPRGERRERRKSKVNEVLEDLGLGGVAAAVLGKSRSRSRHRGDERSRSGDRDRGSNDARKKWQQAAKAALIAGATEAVRSRKEPGPWTGAKGQRIATAALGAAGIDGLLDRDPNKKSKRHMVEAVLGGLAANHIANGPRSRSNSRGRADSRGRSLSRSLSRPRSLFSRSKSRGRSASRGRGLKEVATIGGVAAVGKAIYDRVRSKSRGRARSQSSDSEEDPVQSRRSRYNDNNRGVPPPADDRVGRPRDMGQADEKKRDSSMSSVSSTDLNEQRKKMKGKELLTAGLAAVATIHAAHGVYSSMVASENRHKQVIEGDITPEEARKRKSKNMLQDAAAVGIAAMGIKSAFTEWKEMNEHRRGIHELEEKRRKIRKARAKRQRDGGFNNFQNPANIYMPYPAPVMPYGYYADGNPYAAAGTLPPPPMGAAPAARY